MNRMAVATADNVAVRSGMGRGGYDFFLSSGVKFLVQGQNGSDVKAIFSPTRAGWVAQDNISFLPAGAPPPRAVVGQEIRVSTMSDATQVVIGIDEWVPFRVEEDLEPARYRISFYGALCRVNWIRYDTNDPVVREIRASQADRDTC